MDEVMTLSELATALNELMRRYIADPASFDSDFQTVDKFRNDGEQPSYGSDMASKLMRIHYELNASNRAW